MFIPFPILKGKSDGELYVGSNGQRRIQCAAVNNASTEYLIDCSSDLRPNSLNPPICIAAKICTAVCANSARPRYYFGI